MHAQPDFETLFLNHFGSNPRKVNYAIRFDSSLRHDIQFLSSLIHEASFDPRATRLRKGEVRLPLTRECWELPKIERSGALHLYVARSVLLLKPIVSIRWELPHRSFVAPEGALIFKGIHLCFDYWEPENPGFTLLLHGVDWKCILQFTTGEPQIYLKDHTTPLPDWEFFDS